MADTPYLAQLRTEYRQASLDIADVAADPVVQFEVWFQQAIEAVGKDANAMHLATASASGRPSGRMVLLKEYDHRGLSFYTNYQSRKAQHLEVNPHAALTFFWKELERQVRIEGLTEIVSVEESDAYYHTRPEGARVGAWASPQSRLIASRAELERLYREHESKFMGADIPRPAHWGGYRLRPVLFEFWQGRESRLHDRILYELADDGTWTLGRLAP